MTAQAAPSAPPELSPRRWALSGLVTLSAAAAIAPSADSLAVSPPSSHAWAAGVLVLWVAIWIGRRFPVPVANDDLMTLSSVPIACAAVMYGAAVAALLAATAYVVEDVRQRTHPLRVVFNTGV